MPIFTTFASRRLGGARHAAAAALLAFAASGTAHAAATSVEAIHDFAGQELGERPAMLIAGPDGKLYGSTGSRSSGNGANFGTVFRIDRDGGNYQVLHQFQHAYRSAYSTAIELVAGSDGNLYGYSSLTGTETAATAVNNMGMLFRIAPASGAVSVLYAFPAAEADPYFNNNAPNGAGLNPSGLVERDGVLYGLASRGGSKGAGTAFKFELASGTFSLLHTFGVSDALSRPRQLHIDSRGRLIGLAGTTPFELFPTGGIRAIGVAPPAGGTGIGTPSLLPRAGGGFYGTASGGAHQTGALLALDIDAAPAYTVLHSFDPEIKVSSNDDATYANLEGRNPDGLADAGDGTLLGTATQGGAASNGTIFRFAPDSGRLEIKYAFPYTKPVQTGAAVPVNDVTPNATGAFPKGALVRGDGNAWFGVASHGGAQGLGTVYRVVPGDDDVRAPQIARWDANLMSTHLSNTGGLVYLYAESWDQPAGTVWLESGFVAAVDWSTLGVTQCTGETTVEPDAASGLASGDGSRYGAHPIETPQTWSGPKPTSGRYIFILRNTGAYAYTLRCVGPQGEIQRTLTIEVKQVPQEGDDEVPRFGNGGGSAGLATLAGLALLAWALRARRAPAPSTRAAMRSRSRN
ncbi:hypothetical protein PIGHUM_00142 [Pigmentiphaga humi]|uniref:Uncharacterized protein n=1 Tax=Pigmentiphaga humi TaxID=2478468 RepID=A0A3P4AVM0_9BURK|nr:choice-of-anchor tandem repeat GloVer-containing protein [Pigmentiphaga humi]VCU68094.1 hypothetical protein PIGHUM_00142 [Pigmentiphaga humi]